MFFLSLIVILISLILMATYSSYRAIDSFKLNDPVSFLIIGTDNGGERGNSEGIRADTIIYLTFTPSNVNKNPEINIVSIPRDTLAPIPCSNNSEYQKINSAFSIG